MNFSHAHSVTLATVVSFGRYTKDTATPCVAAYCCRIGDIGL